MARWWVSSPMWQRWSLQDVQAGLNVALTVVSTLGIWVYGRYCWQRSTVHIARHRYVLLPSLLSLATPGEAYDVICLLRHRIFAVRHTRILAQCFVIFLLTIVTLLAGLIARFATQRGTVLAPVNVPGFLAKSDWSNIQSTVGLWNDTLRSLQDADFPRNQLLDFIPDQSKDWVYRQNEWNNSWKADCNATGLTPISLTASGNHSQGSYFFGEVPDARNAFPSRFLGDDYRAIGNFLSFSNHVGVNKDVLLFFLISSDPDWIPELTLNRSMSFSLAAFRMHNAPASPPGTETNFGKGPIEESFYTRVDCDLTRTPEDPDDNPWMAFPWTNLTDSIVVAYGDFYQAGFTSQSFLNQTIYVPPPEELFQFFQAYMITKDTQDQVKVIRRISTHVPTVEISVPFLSVFGLITFLVLAGIVNHAVFLFRYNDHSRATPDTKLDWMLQSVRESSLTTPVENPETRRTSVASLMSTKIPKTELRQEFESATYGSVDPGLGTTDEHRVRRGSSRSYADFIGLTPLQTSSVPEDDEFALLSRDKRGVGIQANEVASPMSFDSSPSQGAPAYGGGRRSSARITSRGSGYGNGSNEDYFRDLGLSPLEGRRSRYQRLESGENFGIRGPGRDYDLGSP